MKHAGSMNQPRWFKLYSRAAMLMLALLILFADLAVSQQSVANADFIIAKPVIDVYKNAAVDSEVTSQALYGTGVLSLEKQGDWIKIRTADLRRRSMHRCCHDSETRGCL